MNKLVQKIDSKLDEAGKLTAFIRTLSEEQVNGYYQSLAERKAEYEIEGKSGWNHIYLNQDEYVPSLVKLACRYRLFSVLVSRVKNENKTTKVKPLDKAVNAFNGLTAREQKTFLKLIGVKAK